MSRVFVLLIAVIVFFFAGCATEQPKSKFEKESEYIVLAYDGLYSEDYNRSYIYLNKLYKKTSNIQYFEDSLEALLLDKKYKKLINLSKDFLKTNPKNITVREYLIEGLIELRKIRLATIECKILLKDSKSSKNYQLLARLYFIATLYELSLDNYKKAYDIEQTPELVYKISHILYKYLKKPDEAINFYETYIRFNGCNFFCVKS